MRRLLVVAYFFPPVGGVGVERTLKHVTYLPELGWQPVVVAPSNSGYRIVDEATLERVPTGTEVHRARTFEPAHLRRAVGRLVGRGGSRPSPHAATPASASRGGLVGELRRAANAAWAATIPHVFFPDDQVLWVPAATRAALRAHRAAPVDAVYSSSPPASSHLAARRLAERIGVPWIADFRDPLVGNAFAPDLTPAHRALKRRLERWIVEGADRVVVATRRMQQQYAARYPELADRFVHIPNGYDLADLAAASAQPPPDAGDADRFHLVYAGSMYSREAFGVFLDGVERLLSREPSARHRLRATFVGLFNPETDAIAERRVPALEPVVRRLGLRPRAEAIALQQAADAGLIILAGGGDRALFATTKLYEYLGLDLPVLAVTPPGEVREILAELDWGVAADPTPDGVAAGLAAIMSAPRPDRAADPERRYERRSLTSRLAGLLDEVVPG